MHKYIRTSIAYRCIHHKTATHVLHCAAFGTDGTQEQYLTGGERYVHEEYSAGAPPAQPLLLSISHHLRQQHEVVVVHPHDICFANSCGHVVCKGLIESPKR